MWSYCIPLSERPPMVYGDCKTECKCDHHFRFGPSLTNEVLVYKYLGLDIDHKLIFKDFKNRILNKSRANLGRIWNMGIRGGMLSIKAAINLYQALIISGFEFSSEIWGFDKWEDGESIQYTFSRYILQSSSMTSKPALIGELGLMSLYGRRNYKKLSYWFHIITS